MKVCENCKSVFKKHLENCCYCNTKLLIPKKTDEFLKKFLEIDDKILKRFKEVRKETIKEAKKRLIKKGGLKAIGIAGSARGQFDMAAESSNSEFLLIQALEELKKNKVKTELISLRKFNIKPCKACYSTTNTQCHFYCSCYPRGSATGDDMSNILYDKILEADIIIFATPVNNFKMSTMMSLFLDRCISLDGSLAPADPRATKNKELNIKHTKFVEIMADEGIPGSGFFRRFNGKTAGVIVTGHEEGAAMVISSLFMTLNHFGMVFAPWSNVYAMSSITNPTYKDKKIVTSQEHIDDVKKMTINAYEMAKKLKEKPHEWSYDYSAN
ncbi:MAG: flavodoxin family protein [Bacteriovorax sp.]|nr:flavodoxin family protein [Bacteriovorax sp.]